MHCELASETNPTNVLRYNQSEKKNTIILQSQLLYQTTSNILNKKRLFKATSVVLMLHKLT